MLNEHEDIRDEPVAALHGLPQGGGFRYWRGRSGRRYLHTVHMLADWPGYAEANVIFTRRLGDESREVVWVGQVGPDDSRPGDDGLFARMAKQGASEVHVHLLAGSARARRAVERDLKEGLRLLRPVE